MLKIREAIVVEGKYDKNTLSQIVDTLIITTEGFGIFRDKEKMALLRKVAESRGLIVLTDSDGAGFLIRSRIKGSIPAAYVRHAYIPDIPGKERRKRTASREGTLGVEGMTPDILRQVLLRAGATPVDGPIGFAVTKADMNALGLSGGPDSASRRKFLQAVMNLPEKLSANGLLDVVNALYDREAFLSAATKILQDYGRDSADQQDPDRGEG